MASKSLVAKDENMREHPNQFIYFSQYPPNTKNAKSGITIGKHNA